MMDSRLIEEFSQLYDEWLARYEVRDSYDLSYMVSGIAHEIRNPLSLIRATLQLLEIEKDPKLMEKKLPIIYRELGRIDELVSEFLDLSSSTECEFQWVDIHHILKETYDLFELAMKEKNIDFHLRLHKESPMLLGDEKRLKQVFINLIKNALEATEPNGFVYIHSTMDERTLHISVKDSGSGIPQEHIEDILTPFYTTKSSGTGLGLAIVQEIIKIHNGSLSIYSEPENGSEFIVSIPIGYEM